MVNLYGQVIGITVAGGGAGSQRIGYAMPINQVLAIARQLDLARRLSHVGRTREAAAGAGVLTRPGAAFAGPPRRARAPRG